MIWGAVAGLGAAALILSLGSAVLFLLWNAGILTFPSAPGFTAAYVPALLLGIVVARAVGGWIATLGVVALAGAAVTRLLVYVDPETLFAYSAIPAGLLLGAGASAIVGRRHIPFRHPLEAAGVFGVLAIPSSLIDTAARLSPPSDPYVLGLTLALLGTMAAGVLLAHRSPQPVRDATVLAGALVVIGLVMLPTLWMGATSDARNVASAAVRCAQPLILIGTTWLATRVGLARTRTNVPRAWRSERSR